MSETSIDYEELFRFGPSCIVIKADPPRYTIVTANEAYVRRSRRTLEDLKGIEFFNSFLSERLERDADSFKTLFDSFERLVASGEQQILPSLHVEVKDEFGNPRHSYLRILTIPIKDEAGELVYIMHTAIDISDAIEDAQKKQSAFELADTQRRKALQLEQRLRLAVDSAQLGTWQYELSTAQLSLSPRTREVLGVAFGDSYTAKDFISQINDSDREQLDELLKASLANHDIIDVEIPIVGFRDGTLRWVKITGKYYPGNNKTVGRLLGTVMDITERVLTDMRKNDFITLVSHELKTPLTIIKALIQMLIGKAKKQSDDIFSVSLQKVHIQVEKMRKMIEGFLNVARIEDGKLELIMQHFDLSDMIRQAVAESEISVETNTVTLDLSEPLFVYADKEKLMQVINNLLSNARKYSAPGSTIAVECTVSEDMALVRVKDEGIGIPVEHADKLFNRFYRIANRQTSNISGFGIGLYLCRQIIRGHNGRIWVESNQGKGSSFYFTLPLAAPGQ